MKKMKLAVVVAALVSVFGFSSCLDSGESGPQQYGAIVTVGNSMGIPYFLPDFGSKTGLRMYPNVSDLKAYGISSTAKRAAITFTLPEGTEWTSNTKQLDIALVAGGCSEVPVENISNRPDTCITYVNKIQEFSKQNQLVWAAYYPSAYAEYGYLTLLYSYLTGSKRASSVLLDNRASNDTLYLDLKLKCDGSSQLAQDAKNYDLSSSSLIDQVIAKEDSIYITIVAESSLYGTEKKDSVTTRSKRVF